MAFTKLDLPGADVAHCPQFLTPNLADHFERILTETLPWKQRQVIIAGVSYDEPRVTAWHGRAYAYSGNVLEPEPMTGPVERVPDLSIYDQLLTIEPTQEDPTP